MNFVAWGRLLRLSLLPTAIADIAAGAVWAQGGLDFARHELWLLVAASLCVYHGGMALNDWADRKEDARTRPGRPIPSGAVSPNAALAVGIGLIALAPVLAFRVDRLCGLAILGVSVCAAAYDFFGRGAWLGPSLLALCRAGNLGAGVLLGVQLASMPMEPALVVLALLPLAYGAYVFAVSRVGRLEDIAEPLGRRPAPWIGTALACLALSPVLAALIGPRWEVVPLADVSGRFDFVNNFTLQRAPAGHPIGPLLPHLLAGVVVVWAAVAPLRLALTTREWTGALAMRATGMLLRRLLIFTAVAAISRGSLDGLVLGGAILCGYPLAFALRRVFPPS